MKINTIQRVMCLLLILPMLLSGCLKDSSKIEVETPNVYFFDISKGRLFSENLSPEFLNTTTDIEKIQFVVDSLQKGPKDTIIPVGKEMPIKDINKSGKLVLIYFGKGYNDLSAEERIAMRTTLVYSLTELDFIEGVEFFIEDQPLVNANGDKIGPIYRGDIVTKVLEPNPPTTIQTITLYFASSDGTKLVKEERDIALNNSIPIEKYIVEELIKGPKKEGHIATIPSDTVIKDVTTKEAVCQVDLSFDLKSKFFTTPESKTLMIYSIVNSLTEVSKIKKVAFLVDGKKEIEFSKYIDLRESFERDDTLIE